jgi:hypothetical protein
MNATGPQVGRWTVTLSNGITDPAGNFQCTITPSGVVLSPIQLAASLTTCWRDPPGVATLEGFGCRQPVLGFNNALALNAAVGVGKTILAAIDAAVVALAASLAISSPNQEAFAPNSFDFYRVNAIGFAWTVWVQQGGPQLAGGGGAGGVLQTTGAALG